MYLYANEHPPVLAFQHSTDGIVAAQSCLGYYIGRYTIYSLHEILFSYFLGRDLAKSCSTSAFVITALPENRNNGEGCVNVPYLVAFCAISSGGATNYEKGITNTHRSVIQICMRIDHSKY